MMSSVPTLVLMGLAVTWLLSVPTTAAGTSSTKGHDALEDDTDDAAAYARYMAATEASAPLMQRRSQQHHDPAANPVGRSSPLVVPSLASGSTSSHHGGASIRASTPFKSIYRSSGGHVTLLHSSDYATRRRLVHVWSPWSSWSPCSRTCGGGITARHRTCRIEYARVSEGSGIRSSYQQCTGESSEYSSCNPQSCSTAAAGHPEDFRLFQCSLYNNRTVRGHYVATWTPYQMGANQCELSCRAGNRPNGLVYSFGKVLDGTRCTIDPENPYKDFCINGRCLAVGCDGRVGSAAKRDMCHVCGGNNGTCQRVAAVAFSQQSADLTVKTRNPQRVTETYGYSPVVRIPRGATHIRLTDNSSNYLALMDERERYFLNGNWIVDWPGRYETSGVAFHYERIKDSEIVHSRGPLQQDLIVMVLVREKDPAVYYEYWMPRQAQLFRMTVDAFASDAQRVVSARPTVAPTTALPLTTRRAVTTSRMTTSKPTTTTPSAVIFQHRNSTAETDLNEWEQYEPQPTAASLVRSPPRITYGGFMIPFFNSITTSTTTTPRTTTTTSSKPTKKSRPRSSKKKANGVVHDIEEVRHHLGLIHKKHPKTSAVRSAISNGHPGSCSVDGSCWKTVNGKKHFCLSEFVLRCKVLGYEVINGETRYEIQVVQSYKNMIPILSREFIWAEPVADCPCPSPYLRTGTDYIIMGKTDRKFRRNEIRLLLDSDSYVRVYNQANAERVLRIRRDEAKFCQKYKTKFNLTT
ncbi:hypothetical protein GHT06_011926 [Daphnia sinensis]|uniref:NTR domain-containing protein n=1 Tax=Daphnia sinensis TaxID=1820382 RepID=A0AAD5PZE0_9CRUS|nr:hypothetical protein GHT06_011926 [Daphnia sinensis]